jgi:hypothetical protein
VHEPGIVEVQTAGRILPSQVEGDAVRRLAIAQPLQPLQHHHHRHNPWGYRRSSDVGEQIGERLV